MRNRFFLTAFLLLLCYITSAQKDTCKVGVYINSLYDFRLDDKSFVSDFWMWMNYKNDSLKFENAAEITNSKSVDFSHFSHEKIGEWNWVAQKCKAQLKYEWDVAKFPFDEQHFKIEIEDAEYDTSRLIYIADKENSKINKALCVSDWTVENFVLKEGIHTYETNYGNPVLSGGHSSYSGITAEITLRRDNSWQMLAKMLTGAYVAFLISCIVFFVSSENQDSRFGLCVGGLFAAIGNKYIVESIVPTSSVNTLMDNVHNLTLTFILFIVVIITISLHLFESGDERKKRLSFKLDKISFFTLMILFTIINAALIWIAMS